MKNLNKTKMNRKKHSKLLTLGILALLFLGNAQAQGLEGNITTPKNPAWIGTIDMSNVPNTPVRPVGSGVCKDAQCDGTDNEKCFETCGNQATSSDVYGCPGEKVWALTFDDGPSNYTHQLLDILDQHKVKATFCVMGAHAQKYPDVLRRAYNAGHQIVSHTYSHAHLMSLSNEDIVAEVKSTEDVIHAATGARPRYIRPPFGEADSRVKALLKAMGYKVLMWNVDPTDYNIYMQPNAGEKIRGTFDQASEGVDQGLNPHNNPGFISLQHDLYTQSIAEVPYVIKMLQQKGYKLVTAAECVNDQEAHNVAKNPLVALAQSIRSSSVSASASASPTASAPAATTATKSGGARSFRVPAILSAVVGISVYGLLM